MSVCDLKTGKLAYVEKVVGNDKLAKRLMALGFINGGEVKVKGAAPLGDPIVLNIKGYDIAIRKKDAANIRIREA
ncbi:MAG TPA: ferrous iron transport protein A [Clostridiaceae bacterium]|jgi:ferrous iron transport protein A|nr:ferrous iron transport protein A [Clostridiaceae bacterium]HBF76769.1 ferrous iron transport protein A [Clostridiaceae bacterium]HBG37629.1 ferrous iron transport protein A [Clostridiaceae bacterium]HBN28215.1 ferrous iron transport protein A [Clostridiaceae bacterium]HBX48448.1 ferrous iron transport protein A [Clostridiaceae bacterium]